MNKKIFTLGLCALLAGGLQSCKQEAEPIPTSAVPSFANAQLQAAFAKPLSKALQADPALRQFLRDESLKAFDQDNDILYHMVKDVAITGGETFRQRLLHYIEADELADIERKLPLLTIFVPTLPSGFSPATWQPMQQIPQVAVRNIGQVAVPLYNAKGEESVIPQGSVPGFPVVVVKQNERVVVDPEARAKLEGEKQSFYQNAQFSFFFTGQVFDNVTKTTNSLSRTAPAPTNNYVIGLPISYRNIRAYENEYANPGYQWQRDYVYYGITPTTPKGPLRLNFKENFRTMRLSKGGISFMAGDSQDPGAPTVGSSTTTSQPAPDGFGPGLWMDGQYEFLLLVTTNAKDGSISPRPFKFYATPSSLYDISYNTVTYPGGFTYYQIKDVTPKEFNPSIVIGTWDLTVSSTAWTYQLYEENQTVDRTVETTVQTTFAANFEVDLTFGIVKSAKFGASGNKVETVKTTLHYITGSSDLGQQVLNFGDPIITAVNATYQGPNRGLERYYTTYDLAPGGNASYVYMSIEPYSIVESENNYYP